MNLVKMYIRNTMERINKRLEIKSTLVGLTPKQVIILKTKSDCVQARMLAKEMRIGITIVSLPDGTFALKLRETPKFEVIKPSDCVSFLPSDTPIDYASVPKHWELKTIPLGKSGVPLTRLGYFADGHFSIPETWLVYDADLNLVFKPKYVMSPRLLTNSVTRKLGLPDTKIMLDQNYEPLPAGEAEARYTVLERTTLS